MKNYLFALVASTSVSTMAGGTTSIAVPTGIDIVRNEGFMMYGEFGNVGSCSVSNQVFVKASHPQYNQIYSTALAAFMAGKKVYVYAQACEPVSWYSVATITYNTLIPDGGLMVRN